MSGRIYRQQRAERFKKLGHKRKFETTTTTTTKKKGNDATGGDESKTALKHKKRSLERLIKKLESAGEDVSAKRKDLESIETSLKVVRPLEKPKDFSNKYKHIRFFERRKVERKLTQIRKKLNEVAADDSEADSLRKQLKQQQDDLNYIRYFPSDRRYVSLFPHENKDDPTTLKLREEIRQEIASRREHIGSSRVVREREKAVAKEVERKRLDEEDDFLIEAEEGEEAEEAEEEEDGNNNEEEDEEPVDKKKRAKLKPM